MTSEEARRMAGVALEADSGCSCCVRTQIHRLVVAFPKHQSVILEVWLTSLKPDERKAEFAEMLGDLKEEEEEGVK